MGWVAKMLLFINELACYSLLGMTSWRTQKPRRPPVPAQAVNGSKGAEEWRLQTREEVRVPVANSPVRQKERQEPP